LYHNLCRHRSATQTYPRVRLTRPPPLHVTAASDHENRKIFSAESAERRLLLFGLRQFPSAMVDLKRIGHRLAMNTGDGELRAIIEDHRTDTEAVTQ
jgi:hypothetical protein